MYTMEEQLIRIAQEAGFQAAVIAVEEIPVNGSFRKYCEENRCGKYDANYSCPPACGTVEEVHQRLLAEEKALVLQMIYEIGSYENKEAIQCGREKLNKAVLDVAEQLRQKGLHCLSLGYGGCTFCDPCRQTQGLPCILPEKRISCMSAYCIDVAKLAERCGMEFDWIPEKLFMFGMIAFSEKKNSP